MSPQIISVFYYEKFGYIIASCTEFKDSGIPTVINPVITVDTGISPMQLGEKMLEAFEKSRKAVPLEKGENKGFHYWHVSGITDFGKFSNKFRYVKVFQRNNSYEFYKMDRAKNGGYIISQNKDAIYLSPDIPTEQIGETTLSLL